MLLIKPRYLGGLVKKDPLSCFVCEKFDEAFKKSAEYKNSGDADSARIELGKMQAYNDVFSFLCSMHTY